MHFSSHNSSKSCFLPFECLPSTTYQVTKKIWYSFDKSWRRDIQVVRLIVSEKFCGNLGLTYSSEAVIILKESEFVVHFLKCFLRQTLWYFSDLIQWSYLPKHSYFASVNEPQTSDRINNSPDSVSIIFLFRAVITPVSLLVVKKLVSIWARSSYDLRQWAPEKLLAVTFWISNFVDYQFSFFQYLYW